MLGWLSPKSSDCVPKGKGRCESRGSGWHDKAISHSRLRVSRAPRSQESGKAAFLQLPQGHNSESTPFQTLRPQGC